MTALAVVGGANVDFIVPCATLPAPGETVLGGDLVRLPGGKAANQAAALARLGGDVELVVAVGDDDHGRFLRREWADRGVRTSFVQSSQRPTGVALIPVSDDGENMIVVASGANRDLAVDDVPLEEFEVVVTQLETSLDVLDELLARSRRVVLNVAPARQLPTALVARAALVVANEIEVRSLVLDELSDVVVTRGAEGAQYFHKGRLVAESPAPRVDVRDSVGAGDAAVASMALSLALGHGPDELLRRAVVAGSLATRAPGAQGSLATQKEVEQWLQREW